MKTYIALLRGLNVGRSILAAKCEKILGVSMTDRNWRTVRRIRDLVFELNA